MLRALSRTRLRTLFTAGLAALVLGLLTSSGNAEPAPGSVVVNLAMFGGDRVGNRLLQMMRFDTKEGELRIPNKSGYFELPHNSVSLDTTPFLVLKVKSRLPTRVFVELKGSPDVPLLEQKFIIEFPSTNLAFEDFACDLRALYRVNVNAIPPTKIVFSDVGGGVISLNSLSYSPTVPAGATLLEWDMRRFAKLESDPHHPLPEFGVRNLLPVINFVADQKGVNFKHKSDELLLLPRPGRFTFSVLPQTLSGQPLDTNILDNPWLVLIYAADRKTGVRIEMKGKVGGQEIWLLGSKGTVAPYRKMIVSLPATGGKLRLVCLPMWEVINTAPLPLNFYDARVLAFSDITGGPLHLAALGFSPVFVSEPSSVVRGVDSRGEWANWIGGPLSMKDIAGSLIRTVDANPLYYLAPEESPFEFEAAQGPLLTPTIIKGDPFR